MKVHFMTPDEHDQAFAFLSHLPHLLASSLASSASRRSLSASARRRAASSRGVSQHHADGAPGMQDQNLGGHEALFWGASMDCGLSRRLSSDSLIRFSSMISALTVLPVISAVWAIREALL